MSSDDDLQVQSLLPSNPLPDTHTHAHTHLAVLLHSVVWLAVVSQTGTFPARMCLWLCILFLTRGKWRLAPGESNRISFRLSVLSLHSPFCLSTTPPPPTSIDFESGHWHMGFSAFIFWKLRSVLGDLNEIFMTEKKQKTRRPNYVPSKSTLQSQACTLLEDKQAS